VLQATLSFYSVESIELVNAISYGGVFVSSYPMEVYGAGFRQSQHMREERVHHAARMRLHLDRQQEAQPHLDRQRELHLDLEQRHAELVPLYRGLGGTR